MQELQALYQEVIIDHNRNPRNHHVMLDPTYQADGFNPLCGDKLHLFLKTKNDLIEEACFTGGGCAISTASASLMTEFLKGKTLTEAKTMFSNFHKAIIQNDHAAEIKLGKLSVLTGVKAFPARVKCATLAWHTLKTAIERQHEVASTE